MRTHSRSVTDIIQGMHCELQIDAYASSQCLTHSRADQFDVPVPFLLRQAAWLYEHQLSTVRAQMQRISTSRPTSMVGGPELSVLSQVQGKYSLDETANSGSGSGSGNASTVKGSQAGSGRGSFRGSAANLAQTRSALNVVRPSQGTYMDCAIS